MKPFNIGIPIWRFGKFYLKLETNSLLNRFGLSITWYSGKYQKAKRKMKRRSKIYTEKMRGRSNMYIENKGRISKTKVSIWPCGSWCYAEETENFMEAVGLSDDYQTTVIYFHEKEDEDPYSAIDALVIKHLTNQGAKMAK